MTALADIRAGLAANLSAAITDAQITGYLMSSPTPPCFEIEPLSVAYDKAMGRGHDEWRLTVRGIVSVTSDIGAQKRLDRWLKSSGGESVKAALESDRTLGGVCDDLRVEDIPEPAYRHYASQSAPGANYLGAEWTVLVIASGA